MKIQGKYSRKFKSDNLTKNKYNLLEKVAMPLLEFKNKISEIVNNNIMLFLNMSKFEFISYFRTQFPKHISSYFEEGLYTQVYTCYQNRFDSIIKKISFKKRTFVLFNFYKRDTKNNKKGDLKSLTYKIESTDLSITLTYLARYGNENIIDYINSIYDNEKITNDKRNFYDVIIKTVNKFGFNKLYKLALLKRNRILNNYLKDPIQFTSLTIVGKTSKIKLIIEYNKNRHSKISAFISINSITDKWGELFDIPIKYSHKFHGNISDYQKDVSSLYIYTLTFDYKHKEVDIILCKDGERYLPENNINYIGIDVNVKHNLFALSDGSFYDFDREFVNDYIKELNKLDELKKNKEYKQGKRRLIKFKTLQRKIKSRNLKLISDICKDLVSNGYNHIVMENIDNSFSKSYSKNEEYNEKYNRLNHILLIGSLKNEFQHIAPKYGISVSLIHAEYTSLMCSHCGCIDSDNRLIQELFICVECGCVMNADTHAAINIRDRVSETVFHTLLNKQPDGSYLPKKLSHDKICEKIRKSIMKLVKLRNTSPESYISNINNIFI